MDAEKKIEIRAEVTPNPHTLKFHVNKILLESGSLNFTDKEKAKTSPLTEQLFNQESVIGVMIGRDFITVTKKPDVGWQAIVPAIAEVIKSVLSTEEVAFAGEKIQAEEKAAAGGQPEGDIEKKIKEILDSEIRPAVAMDGGDIVFIAYHNGIVTLHLQGSCSSCPSSVMTLKMGVENRLKQSVPEVREVVQV